MTSAYRPAPIGPLPSAPPPLPPPQRGWWSRNWKWAGPLGCLLPVLLCGGLITAGITLVFGMMKSSEPYKHALSVARTDSTVITMVGTPVEAGMFVSGNINLNNDNGTADLHIPISGPNGSGSIHVVATKTAGSWTYSTLTFTDSRTQTDTDLKTGETR